jgi:hypothetical protein
LDSSLGAVRIQQKQWFFSWKAELSQDEEWGWGGLKEKEGAGGQGLGRASRPPPQCSKLDFRMDFPGFQNEGPGEQKQIWLHLSFPGSLSHFSCAWEEKKFFLRKKKKREMK